MNARADDLLASYMSLFQTLAPGLRGLCLFDEQLELRGSEGLGRTKDALQLKLRELVPEARFRALYISDFVVQ